MMAESIGIPTGVAGVNGVYVTVSPKGWVTFVDGTTGSSAKSPSPLEGKPPYSVACSISDRETCAVTDSIGSVWIGPCRADGRVFSKVV
jgi:hypothetical protein